MREVYRRLFWSYDGGPFIFVPQRSFFTKMLFSYGYYGSGLGDTGNGFYGIHQSWNKKKLDMETPCKVMVNYR